MSQPQDLARQVFADNLSLIHKVISQITRRYRLRAGEAEDFTSSVLLRLIENDYKILCSFRGTSSLRTYLIIVIHRLFLNFRAQARGKWRPSEAVRRLGKKAEELDRLLSWNELSLDHALEILQGRHGRASRDEWLALAASLPPTRGRRRYEGDESLDSLGVDGAVDERIIARDRRAALRTTRTALATALRELPAQDLLILRMRYQDGFTIRKIAATLRIEDRFLYRRLAGCLKRLRDLLEQQGVRRQDICPLLGEPETEAGLHGAFLDSESSRRPAVAGV